MIRLRRRSIRFRLTAWYAGVLVLAILVFAVTINEVISRRLNDNIDNELHNTATAIQRTANVQRPIDGFPVFIQMPAIDPFSVAGYFIQVYDTSGSSEYRSESLGQRNLPMPDLGGGLQAPSYHTVSIDGQQMRIINAPLRLSDSDKLLGVLVVATSTDQYKRAIQELRTAVVAGSIIAIILAVVGGWFLAGRALRPVERMRREAFAIAAEGSSGPMLSERIQDPGTNDEISRLAQTFNDLLDRIEAAFDTERRFIADASHELRTPLTAIRGNVDVLLMQARRAGQGSPEQREALEDVQREAGRMSRLLEDLLTLARADAEAPPVTADMSPVAITEPVARAIRTAQALDPERVISAELAGEAMVRANPDQVEQVVLILLDNAIRHSEVLSPVTLSVRATEQQAVIRVTDQGEGIAEDVLPHLFDRFYRVDSARSRASGGTGLGLAIAQSIVQRSGGAISVTSTPNEGTTFTITWPLASPLPANR